MKKTCKFLERVLNVILGSIKSKSTEYIEAELRELENVFALLLLGSLIGLPSPPTSVSLRLLPYLGRELVVMVRVGERLDDMLGEMAGLFEIT